MAGRYEHAADDYGAMLTQQTVGDEAAQDRREIGEPGIEAEKLRSERLRIEPSEQEFERGFDCADTEHRIDSAWVEQIFRHVQHDKRGIAEIGKALPRLAREQNGEPARMAEKVAASRRCCRRVAFKLRDHERLPGRHA